MWYLDPSEFPFGFGGGGMDETIDTNDHISKTSGAVGKNKGSRDKGWSKTHPDLHQKKVQKWLDANVTLDDGVKYEIVKTLEHDKKAFTEGLCYVNGRLFESVGLNGKSDLRELDPDTGKKLHSHTMAHQYFGEGLTYVDGKLVQLTWQSKTGFKYDVDNIDAKPTTFPFSTTKNEGWGLTYDASKHVLIESDGSAFLHFWDASTMQQVRKVKVFRQDGNPAKNINELEFWRGKVLANIWFKDVIIVIDPETGYVEKEYNFEQLWEKRERHQAGADVLNGISVSHDPDLLYITGKLWDRMYLVRLLP
eukprot:CAMPEP_0168822520 /NCGR_PEP_ID=MMETSP0726-20121227/10015_1 /TAXON_ID=265536 /ORGANISM="Amphiprora sp., Strain CCMP467" /LENGTH=306 /DNA_ID=CAMNT_0008875281 /DNA_START=66 /DNA_END=986 /DNA_ORIENTATION=+